MNSKLRVRQPMPLLSAYQMGDQIHVQFGPTIPDKTACMLEVAQALIVMARQGMAKEKSVVVAPPGLRVPRSG